MHRQPSRSTPTPPLLLALTALVLHAPPAVSAADLGGRQELLVFLSAAIGDQFNLSGQEQEQVDSEDFLPTADLLYTYNNDSLRVLGEYLWTSEEHELERLQIGWQVGDETMLWFGRFHQPGTVWNTTYHHGQYMQTSISRPGIEQWEDDGGILLEHSTGILLESSVDLAGQSQLQYALSAGSGALFDGEHIEPLDLLDPNGDFHLAYAFQVSYLPDALGDNKLGLVGDYTTIDIDDAADSGLHHVKQLKLGAYADWRWGRWRLLPTFYAIRPHLEGPDPGETEWFHAYYVQAEYGFRPAWTAYARAEDISNTGSAYVSLFADLVSSRRVLGLRWDPVPKHAITLEFLETKMPSADFTEAYLQWSAVFP